MKIEEYPIESLVPYYQNTKKHDETQVKNVAESLRRFGWQQPIVIDEDNVVVIGHCRLEAAKLLGLKKVPVTVASGLSPTEIRQLRIVDNKTNESPWDMEMLSLELRDFDLDGFDFDFDLDGELGDEDDGETEEDDYSHEPAENPLSVKAGLYRLGRHYLLCGDSTNAEDIERLMGGEKADMIFTDPPWNVAYGSHKNHPYWKNRTITNDSMDTEAFSQFMRSAFSAMADASKPGAMTYVVMSAQEWGNLMLGMKDSGFHWSSTIIWNKDSLVLSRKDYHTRYEPIWYGWKDGASRLHPLRDRKQCDVWDINRPKKSDEHPTMKPVELVARAIKNSSSRDDVILDPFGGSGTTLIAAEQTGRRCFTCELEPKYVDVIINRYIALTGNTVYAVNPDGSETEWNK